MFSLYHSAPVLSTKNPPREPWRVRVMRLLSSGQKLVAQKEETVVVLVRHAIMLCRICLDVLLAVIQQRGECVVQRGLLAIGIDQPEAAATAVLQLLVTEHLPVQNELDLALEILRQDVQIDLAMALVVKALVSRRLRDLTDKDTRSGHAVLLGQIGIDQVNDLCYLGKTVCWNV